MNIFGLSITKAQPQPVSVSSRGWWPIFEANSQNWQRNIVVDHNAVLAYDALFACLTLIAGDISKNRVKLVAQSETGIWQETTNAAYSPVLRKPNRFQTRIQFYENWVLSKLQRGNTYVLKERDNRGVVVAMYVLDPNRVTPQVTPDGAVYYELRADNMAGLEEARVMVPASEIIHDRFNCLFHPLVGISPIYASGLAATQGLRIQNNSANLFGNGSQPGGLLIAPRGISPEDADKLKEHWDTKYTGSNAGKVAVLSGDLEFKSIAMNAADAQLIEQLKWTAEVVCSAFHVPPYKIGVGTMPTYNNIQSLNVEYYSQCLQVLIESIELCLDEGLGIGQGVNTNGTTYGTEFDIENLLRMDSVTQMSVLKEAVSAGVYAPNEARAKVDRVPVEGGESPYLQQQNYSLAALAKRDAQDDPFAKDAAKPSAQPDNDNDPAIPSADERRIRGTEKRLQGGKEALR
jgi:HK97 family phage portal protein